MEEVQQLQPCIFDLTKNARIRSINFNEADCHILQMIMGMKKFLNLWSFMLIPEI